MKKSASDKFKIGVHMLMGISSWSEMTVIYHWRIVERCPKLNGAVGSSKLGREIFSQLDGKTSQVVTCPSVFQKKRKDGDL
jgi:hypothetical protein